MQHVTSTISHLKEQLEVAEEHRTDCSDTVDNIIFRISRIARLLHLAQSVLQIPDALFQTIDSIILSVNRFQSDALINNSYSEDSCELIISGGRGRPCYNIPPECLDLLASYGFTVRQMSILLKVSERTLFRRFTELDYSVRGSFATLSDADLDVIVQNILAEFPNTGIRRMQGFLLARGYKIQEERVRATMHRCDPTGILERTLRMRTVCRRVYSVPCALALWHLDGNNKLIRQVSISVAITQYYN